jgi:hypothetical protein
VAMSEPLFIFLSLLSLWMFDLYFERDHHWLWLVAGGAFVGMAYLTRYAGLALLATFVVALVILQDGWRKRVTGITIFVASTLPWIFGWSIRNRIVAESATNRTFAWHPITAENIQVGLRTVSEAFFPVEAWRRAAMKEPYIIEGLVVIILGAVLVWLAFRTWSYIRRREQTTSGVPGRKSFREVISFTTGLYLFAYLASIVSSMLMFDAATKFRLRILSPVFVCLLILMVYAGVQLRRKNRAAVLVLTLVFVSLSVYKQLNTVSDWSRGGLGYASFQWYDSKVMAYLRELPAEMRVYTDEPAAVYLYTGRGNYVLPSRFDSATALPREGFDDGLATMKDQILAGQAVLVIFKGGAVSDEEEVLFSEDLHLAHKSAGDAIYTAPP